MDRINTAIQDELLQMPTSNPVAELAGFFDVLPVACDDDKAHIASPKLAMARRLLKLWRGLNEAEINATIEEGATCAPGGILQLDRKKGKVSLSLPRRSYEAVKDAAGVLSKPALWSWFRGVWGASGAVYLPQSGYYMSLRVPDRREILRRIGKTLSTAGITPKLRKTGAKLEVTVRNQEEIVTCLSGMGFGRVALMLEETAIMRSMRERANKLVNCDSANIFKTVSAASEQMRLVECLDRERLWDEIPEKLAELAQARREYPSASLSELGQLLSKPVSKSTVEYRWKKLASIIRGTE